MGTRSLTTFIESYKDQNGKKKKKKLITMYRQYDGYPEDHGLELANFLCQGEMVNGLSIEWKNVQFNGMGCLSAQVVEYFKNGSGGIYLQREHKNSGECYRYEIISDFETNELTVKILEVGYMKLGEYINKTRTIFKGTPKEMVEYCNK